jgi:hypothetical protein
MSKYVQVALPDEVEAALLYNNNNTVPPLWQNYINPLTGNKYNSVGECYGGLCSTRVASELLGLVPTAGITNNRNAVMTAQSNLLYLLNPFLSTFIEFTLGPPVVTTVVASVPHNSSNNFNCTFGILPGSNWADNCTFSLITGNNNITGNFSPASRNNNGNTTCTVTVGNSVPPGNLQVTLIGTDSTGLTNSIIYTIIIT